MIWNLPWFDSPTREELVMNSGLPILDTTHHWLSFAKDHISFSNKGKKHRWQPVVAVYLGKKFTTTRKISTVSLQIGLWNRRPCLQSPDWRKLLLENYLRLIPATTMFVTTAWGGIVLAHGLSTHGMRPVATVWWGRPGSDIQCQGTFVSSIPIHTTAVKTKWV